MPGTVAIIGGTQGLGRRLAEHFAATGHAVVLTGRDAGRAQAVAAEIGSNARGCALDLAQPHEIGACLQGIENVDHIVLAAVERDSNSVREYDVARAIRLATLKLVGYTEVVHRLHHALHERSSILLYGGLAKERPYPGSTTVTSVNGAVSTMVRTFAIELAPVRVNAVHPGIVGDSPAWVDNAAVLDAVIKRTPTGRTITTDEVTDAALFLLRNGAMNGVNLNVDGGWVLT
ncbi:MAG TPA: SDR family oxidoreductase [Solirubrobacteraceae bacterium]|nr:SDR family oxidoreductase [Solirubrobacteraceae bacterium]